MSIKKDFPILEFDPSKEAMIEPHKLFSNVDIPERCVVTFFRDVVEKLDRQGKLRRITSLRSEGGMTPVYELEHEGQKVAVYHSMIGAPSAVATLEEVIALGAKMFIACGGAGVLRKDIAVGHLVVPDAAVRDEGTSYHYLPPSREVEPDDRAVNAIEEVLRSHKIKYLKAKTWTTDAFYRETRDKVLLRKEEGCVTVEMECAAFFAAARFRKVPFAQILYGGDDLSCEEWDSRCWHERSDIREKVFWLAVESCLKL